MSHDAREALKKQGCLIGTEIFIKWKIKVEIVTREANTYSYQNQKKE